MDQLEMINRYMKDALTKDNTGHSIDHINRVLALANKILAHEKKADAFVVRAAALLHDVYDDKLYDSQEDILAAKNNMISFLLSIGVHPEMIEEITYIIDNMSWSKLLEGTQDLNINGQIVQDADRFEAIGAIAITRAITYGAVKNRVLYDPEIQPHLPQNKTDYRNQKSTTINHFYEKLLLIQDKLNTDTARKISESRQQFMLSFLAQFKAEWELER
ncbi:HD domain-containing protein [Leuconostoc mesenteroides]|uniref:HD domain-containing protein n=1 Tax=Leuconostoc mesenteroides TaxID=1245 RepID=UPI0009FBB3EE|nr:HD domain-containing protein [Leuconostoc mesenteroides]ORI39261.1 HD family phosphohydrolase [Leuconostoc mesenteroides subsp. cremoris]ORI39898.1 HD family phosphohydrolase [Leuconostoc mesenteroides subsp. cremoris]ORI42758.1 HD family phosphohydrolase [Leuconostoc mesenteroides subsp. cremoris]ORI44057.1 HD family phosphohydrolase [Leuconostoc mesenteroides subsp. cremoris]ORI44918.1 HD family phosphohydrolase [Leuconostoc mesenteroides subsp. cremoris]